MIIRRAKPEEAPLLSELAMRSNAYCGYDSIFMEGCRKELTLTGPLIADSLTYVLDREGKLQGFYRLKTTESIGELLDLFLEPSLINRGYGRMPIHMPRGSTKK